MTPMSQEQMNQDMLTLDEGQVLFQYPTTVSAESYGDLKDWLDIIMRRMKRVVTLENETKRSPGREVVES